MYLVASYNFNENYYDSSPNGNNPIDKNPALQTDFGVVKFDGIDDRMWIEHSESVDLGKQDYSISIFLKIESEPDGK